MEEVLTEKRQKGEEKLWHQIITDTSKNFLKALLPDPSQFWLTVFFHWT